MTLNTLEENVVIVARSFNLSILSQLWLVKQGIVAEDEFGESCVFSRLAVQVDTRNYRLLVVPDRLQLTFARDRGDRAGIIRRVLVKLIRSLPHTPFVAAGFNMQFVLDMAGVTDYASKLRRIMLPSANPVAAHFMQEDSRFGAYCTKAFAGMRLNLDMRSIQRHAAASPSEEGLQVAFNFHRDLPHEDRVGPLIETLGIWDAAAGEARSITESLVRYWEDAP